ncbi:hypothetical protein AC1031_021998 [Aphanomyces cochlioides]|nr:hypothetical protein AC1031_021998 [Aphanomyces cochlioides]
MIATATIMATTLESTVAPTADVGAAVVVVVELSVEAVVVGVLPEELPDEAEVVIGVLPDELPDDGAVVVVELQRVAAAVRDSPDTVHVRAPTDLSRVWQSEYWHNAAAVVTLNEDVLKVVPEALAQARTEVASGKTSVSVHSAA